MDREDSAFLDSVSEVARQAGVTRDQWITAIDNAGARLANGLPRPGLGAAARTKEVADAMASVAGVQADLELIVQSDRSGDDLITEFAATVRASVPAYERWIHELDRLAQNHDAEKAMADEEHVRLRAEREAGLADGSAEREWSKRAIALDLKYRELIATVGPLRAALRVAGGQVELLGLFAKFVTLARIVEATQSRRRRARGWARVAHPVTEGAIALVIGVVAVSLISDEIRPVGLWMVWAFAVGSWAAIDYWLEPKLIRALAERGLGLLRSEARAVGDAAQVAAQAAGMMYMLGAEPAFSHLREVAVAFRTELSGLLTAVGKHADAAH